MPLRALLEERVTSAAAAGASRGIAVTLVAEADAVVDGDPLLLHRAVGNLLDNALDFSPAGASIEVTLTLKGRQAEIGVRDHGPGIPDHADHKVFEKFYSLPRPGTQRKSTGLGLSFVREIAALHHGRITLRNAPDGGALATLTLPVSGRTPDPASRNP